MRSRLFVILKSKWFFVIYIISILIVVYKLFPIEEIIYKTKPTSYNLDTKLSDSLILLAGSSLKTKDIPIGSIVLYNDTILAVGFNTCESDSSISGHAEINAINYLLRKIGNKRFKNLNREKLVLITTLEPCLMCEGAILEANIKKVVFFKQKELKYWNNLYNQRLNYLWRKESLGLDRLQDSLLEMHPDYKP